jgi:hypothetical protein
LNSTLVRKRERVAQMYVRLGFASALAAVAGVTLSSPEATPWILPGAGLIGCILCSARALRFRRGRKLPFKGLEMAALSVAARQGDERARRRR